MNLCRSLVGRRFIHDERLVTLVVESLV